MDLSNEKGGSSWLSSLPILDHGFVLKSAFQDALCLKYGWYPSNLPLLCTCGKQFSVRQALNWFHGGFLLSTTMSHTVSLLSYWAKSATMSVWSYLYSQSLMNICSIGQPTGKELLGLMLQQRTSLSMIDNAYFLRGFSTPLHQIIMIRLWLNVTINISCRKELMTKE